MSGYILVLAPWVIFAAVLAIICVQLFWPRRPSQRRPPQSGVPPHKRPPEHGDAGDTSRSSGQAAGSGHRAARS
jgi:hypothetical protein